MSKEIVKINIAMELCALRKPDDLPYLKHLRTLEVPLGSSAGNMIILDAIKSWPKNDGVMRLSKLVLEADGVEEDREFRDLVEAFTWVVPEVVVTKLSEDGPRWYEF